MNGEESGRRLWEALRALEVAQVRWTVGEGEGEGLWSPRVGVLLALLSAGGPLSLGSLSGMVRIDRTNVSRLCDRMVARGEVERLVHPTDGRVVLVQLTAAGEGVARALRMASARRLSAVMAHLGPYGEAVISSLHLLVGALGAAPDGGE